MTRAEIELQNALTTTFLANLAFLSEYDNELYHRVDELSRMIENGSYKEKYALDFIMEEGEFDIYDIVNDKYLYDKKPKKINNEFIRKVEFNEENSIFTLESFYSTKYLNNIDPNIRFNIENSEQSIALTLKDLHGYTTILDNFLENKKKRIKSFKKFAFIGVLLGRHIPKIANKINAQIYLVCEKNLEIFRLSLFTVDYTILAKNQGVVFSIMDNQEEEEKRVLNFFAVNIEDNALIKFSTTGVNIDDYIDRILLCFMNIKPTSYDYNRFLYTFVNRASKSLNNYRTLSLNQMKDKFDIFENIPVLYIAAGPSLDDNLEWIKKNQNKFFIVTIGAAYKKLLTNNIRIDMITTLDENDIVEKLQFDDEGVSKIDKNTIVLASVITNERILKKLNQENLFIYEVFTSFHKDNIPVTGFSIGEVTLFILLNMNVKELYLIGLDMALNQRTGNTHFEGNNTSSKYDLENEIKNRSFFGLRDGLITVKGNHGDEVKTTSLFNASIKYIEDFLTKKDDRTKVYNLSTHGAYFTNSIPILVNEIKIDSFRDINIDDIKFKELLKDCSLNVISVDSKLNLEMEIDFLRDKFLKEFELSRTICIETYQEFIDLEKKIISLITHYEFSDSAISYLLRNYFQYIFSYLSYQFNDSKIKNENKKVKKVKKCFEEQIERIIYDYLYFIEKLKG